MPGPAPKPAALRLLQGNPGHRALPVGEPSPPKLSAVTNPPPGLSRHASKHWANVAKLLDDAKVLTVMDTPSLMEYCEAYARYQKALGTYERKGSSVFSINGGERLAPWMNVMERERNCMIRLMCEFGMTPASRTRVKVRKGDGEEKNPFEDLDAA